MGGLMIVVPMGRHSNFSNLTLCQSGMGGCRVQSQLCFRVPFSRIRVSIACSSESADERCLGSLLSRRGMRLWEGRRQGTRRSFKEERTLVADAVVCMYAWAFEAVQRKEGRSSATDSLRATSGRTSGEAHPRGEESSRFRCRGGHVDVSFSDGDRNRGVLKLSAVECNWQGPEGCEMARKGGFRLSDERLLKSYRFLDSLTMQGPSQDGGVVQDRVLGVGSAVLERNSDWGNGKPNSDISRHSSSNIPRRELLKIEELRFSGKMQEGDSSPQVLNLQRALFWLGHLPGLSLTGYFGPETVKALQEFHSFNGFFSPGVWGFHSQQLLWKLLYPETQQRHPHKDILEQELKEFPDYDLLESWRLVKNASGKSIDDRLCTSSMPPGHGKAGIRKRFLVEQSATRRLQMNCQLGRLQHRRTTSEFVVGAEFVASVSSTIPCSMVISQRFGVLLLAIAVLSIIIKVMHFLGGRVYGQLVRKRVMSWRNGVDLRQPRKASQSPLNVQLGHSKSIEGGQVLPYFQNDLRPKSTEKQEKSGCNLLYCLVLFDGQVLRGDYQTNEKILQSARSQLGHTNGSSMEDASNSAQEGKLSPVLSPRQVYQSGSSLEGTKLSHGLDQFQKLEADHTRKVSSHNSSPVQIERSSWLTGRDQIWSFSCPDPEWASWVRRFLAPFFPNKERLPYNHRKASSHRAVVRTDSFRQTKSRGRGVPGELRSFLRSSKFDKELPAKSDTQRWEEKTELDLKKRVDELHKTVESVEQTRVAAMRVLAEEKMINLELEVNLRRQKETAAALEEEVRVLKDSHEALLASLKKYSSSAAARAAAALFYQNWNPSDTGARV